MVLFQSDNIHIHDKKELTIIKYLQIFFFFNFPFFEIFSFLIEISE